MQIPHSIINAAQVEIIKVVTVDAIEDVMVTIATLTIGDKLTMVTNVKAVVIAITDIETGVPTIFVMCE